MKGEIVITEDVIVFLAPGGTHYVGCFGEDRRYFRWPATANGWLSRTGCPATLVDQCYELEPKLGALALKLSGVT